MLFIVFYTIITYNLIMNRLKELRKSHRLSQAEIAKILNITQSGYSLWELEKVTIDNKSLQKLANLYNVSIDYILGKNQNLTELTNDEEELIKKYRMLNELEQTKVNAYMQGIFDNKENKSNTYKNYSNSSFNLNNNNKVTF